MKIIQLIPLHLAEREKQILEEIRIQLAAQETYEDAPVIVHQYKNKVITFTGSEKRKRTA